MSGFAIRIQGMDLALRTSKATQATTARLPGFIGNVVVAGIKRNFVKAQDPETGATWAPIKNRAGRPLRDTGRLQRSIHYEAGARSVSIGTNVIYAATHQFGDPNRVPRFAKRLIFKVFGVTVAAKKVSIPQRRFMPETDKGLTFVAPNLRVQIESILEKRWAAGK